MVGEGILLVLSASDEPLGLGWFVHLMPALVLGACTVFTWRRPMLAGVAFILLAVVGAAFFHAHANLSVLVVITTPLLLAGLLSVLGAPPNRVRSE